MNFADNSQDTVPGSEILGNLVAQIVRDPIYETLGSKFHPNLEKHLHPNAKLGLTLDAAALWMAMIFGAFVKDRESVIFGVWATREPRRSLQKVGGEAPHLLEGFPGPPGPPRPPK